MNCHLYGRKESCGETELWSTREPLISRIKRIIFWVGLILILTQLLLEVGSGKMGLELHIDVMCAGGSQFCVLLFCSGWSSKKKAPTDYFLGAIERVKDWKSFDNHSNNAKICQVKKETEKEVNHVGCVTCIIDIGCRNMVGSSGV